MAKVTAKDRTKTGFSDGSFPVETKAQCRSAIRLRGHSKSHTPSQVLAHVAAAARKNGWKDILALVEKARAGK